jgi:hypothetical protein
MGGLGGAPGFDPDAGTGGGTCSDTGSCGGCGAVDQPCCGVDGLPRWCSGSGATCLYDGTFTCRACGGRGQPCCAPFTFGPMMMPTGTCVSPLACNFDGMNGTCGDAPLVPVPVVPPPPFPLP